MSLLDRLLRWTASLLVRGPGAPFVLGDLEEALRRDLARGVAPWQARRRYLENVLRSAVRLARERIGRRAGALPSPGVSTLDVKLGVRMLAKYPGLAVVGTLAMGLAIALAATWIEAVNDLFDPELPLEAGSRIVGIRNEDVAASEPELPALYDYARWRETVASVDELSAFRTIERNLIVGQGRGVPLHGAEISASGFWVAGVPARVGRTLVDADEEEGAPPVVVLGHEVWRAWFEEDGEAVGRTVRLGDRVHTIVGVMPEGFGFPVRQEFWIPLKADRLPAEAPEPRRGPAVQVFGRLAPGVTLEEAQAEVTAVGRRAAAELPASHEHLRPRVVPYVELFGPSGGGRGSYVGASAFVLLLVLLCANVASLVFARNAGREGEIAIRRALGASRGRIVAQLFVEALVLASVASGLALLGARRVVDGALRLYWQGAGGSPPFWWDEGLAPTTVLGTGAMAALAAVIVGVVPGLRATGTSVRDRLAGAAGGGATLRPGGLWTTVLVAQVAFSVAILPTAMAAVRSWIRTETSGLGLPAEEYLASRIEMDRVLPGNGASASPGSIERFQADLLDLEERLEREPGVLGVTVADRFPGMDHPFRRVQVEGEGAAPRSEDGSGGNGGETGDRPEVRPAFVGDDCFEVLGVPLVAGRMLRSADVEEGGTAVVVNRSFVREILGDRNAVGRRFRYVDPPGDEPGPWLEIVGVVGDAATHRQGLEPGRPPAVYHPLTAAALEAGDAWAVRMAVHVRGEPEAFAPRLRRLATDLDPGLRLHELTPLDQPLARTRYVQLVNELIVGAFALLALVALLISASGTYALMSFTVSRRTREIGIRTALGAGPRGIVSAIFSRAASQLGGGVGVGVVLWVLQVMALRRAAGVGPPREQSGGGPWFLLAVVGIMTLVGLLACGPPTRRALRIEPTEALREE